MNVYIRGKLYKLSPSKSVGKGGEADVFDIGNDEVVKVYKKPNHPDYAMQPAEQAGAKSRIAEHQTKLLSFPKGLPTRVITPTGLATNKNGKTILGYTMPFLRGTTPLFHYSDRGNRHGIDNNQIVRIFKNLHTTVAGVHAAQVVIGDFNDLNILVKGPFAYLIDSDSFQFGPFQCRMFTTKFVDPTHCLVDELVLAKPHSANTDWYAYTAMLMQCLLYVGPYGGIHKPKDKIKRVKPSKRPLHRVTVFNPEVKYPKPAIHFGMLPDDLLHYFQQVFEKDVRGVFPFPLLEALEWTKCSNCGAEHARNICPTCRVAAMGVVTQVVRVRGKVIATTLFTTKGVILYSTSQKGSLHWIYHQEGKYYRRNETGQSIELLKGGLDPKVRYRICGANTLIAKTGQLVVLGKKPETIPVDNYKDLPIFDSNQSAYYWTQGGQLLRNGDYAPEHVGDILQGQTLFWVGASFGFGFYRAGSYSNAFFFYSNRRGITDLPTAPEIKGHLLDATCYFSNKLAWFCTTTQQQGKTLNTCTVINNDGDIISSTTCDAKDGSWLGNIRGKFAVGDQLYSPTDDGIIRVEASGSNFKLKEFPDTEPFVDAACSLHPSKQGVFVVSQHSVTLLKIT